MISGLHSGVSEDVGSTDTPCLWVNGSRRFERSLCLPNVESYSSKYTASRSTIPARQKFQ